MTYTTEDLRMAYEAGREETGATHLVSPACRIVEAEWDALKAERDALRVTLRKVRAIASSCTPAWDDALDKIVALIDAPSPPRKKTTKN